LGTRRDAGFRGLAEVRRRDWTVLTGAPTPRIGVVALGGTIAMRQGPDGAQPALEAEDLLRVLESGPGAGRVELRATTIASVPGAHLRTADVEVLVSRLERLVIEEGLSGAVVTQGTDTIEETGFLLDLLWRRPEPVVVTGAMRHPDLPGADGSANLAAAVVAAGSPETRGLGVLVVLNDLVHAARFVTKVNTHRPDAFQSYPGALGWVIEDRLDLLLVPRGRPRVPRPSPGAVAQVVLLEHTLGDDGRLVAAARSAGIDGLVYEGSGAGHVSPGVAHELALAAETIPVVLTSRTGSGPVLRQTYGFVGSEVDLGRRGLLHGGWLPGRKVRLLLETLLRAQVDRPALASFLLDPYGEPSGLG